MLTQLLLLLAALISEPIDWPQFRGPNSDGHAVGTAACPMEWSETKNVLWKTDIAGLGWSSPVVVGNQVFLTTAVREENQLSLRALALDASSGKQLWETTIRTLENAPAIHSKNSHASPTPIVRDGLVYVHFGAQGLACLAAEDGQIRWSCMELSYAPVHGNGGSPIISEGMLVIVCDGGNEQFVAGVEAKSGKVAWKTPRAMRGKQTHSFVTPTVVTIEGQKQVLAPGPDHFAAYELHSGKELWRVVAPGWSVVPQPAVGHGMVFYNHDYDFPELMAVKLGGHGDVTETNVAWRLKRGAPSTPSPVLVGDELYFVSDDGIASCVDARTGQRHWQERLGGNFSASPIYANGHILLLNETGTATWVEAKNTFASVQTNELPGRTFATPAIIDGRIYLRTERSLYKFGNSN